MGEDITRSARYLQHQDFNNDVVATVSYLFCALADTLDELTGWSRRLVGIVIVVLFIYGLFSLMNYAASHTETWVDKETGQKYIVPPDRY